jgi:TolC family type I secretion outer membrane protein
LTNTGNFNVYSVIRSVRLKAGVWIVSGLEALSPRRSVAPIPGGRGMLARFAVVLCLLFCLPLSAAAQPRDIAGTLSLAYRSNPELLAAQRAVQVANEEVPVALQRFFPRFTASSVAGSGYRDGRNWRDVPGRDLRNRIRTLDLSLTQPIYDGQAMPGLRAAEALVLRARTQLLQVEQSVLQDAASAHAAVLRDREILRLREANMQSLGRLAAVTDRLLAAGDRTIGDLAQVRAQEARAASLLLQARSQLNVSEAAYLRAVTDRAGLLAAPTLRFRVPQTREEAVTAARTDSARVALLRIDQVLAREQADQSAGALQPRVDLALNGGVGRSVDFARGGPSIPSHSDYGSITLQFSMPLYAGPGDYARLRQAREQVLQRIAEQASAANRAEEEAVSTFVRLNTSRQLLEVAGRAVQAQQLALQSIIREIDARRRPLQDQLLAEQQLLDTRVELTAARAEEIAAGFGLLSAIGVLSASFLELQVPLFDPEQDYNATRWRVIGLSRAEGRR